MRVGGVHVAGWLVVSVTCVWVCESLHMMMRKGVGAQVVTVSGRVAS